MQTDEKCYVQNLTKRDVMYPYLLVVFVKKLDSLVMSSDRKRAISSSIFLISASNRSRMLLNSVSMTLKSPNLMGMFRFIPLSAISVTEQVNSLCNVGVSSLLYVYLFWCTRCATGERKAYNTSPRRPRAL